MNKRYYTKNNIIVNLNKESFNEVIQYFSTEIKFIRDEYSRKLCCNMELITPAIYNNYKTLHAELLKKTLKENCITGDINVEKYKEYKLILGMGETILPILYWKAIRNKLLYIDYKYLVDIAKFKYNKKEKNNLKLLQERTIKNFDKYYSI
jgi:hypothetical protein